MTPRFVASLLISAIVACPMWCGRGFCRGSACCVGQIVCEQANDHCCGEQAPADCPQAPSPRSSGASCQGMCGGAVVEAAIDIHDLLGELASLGFLTPTPGATNFTDLGFCRARCELPVYSAGNQGRYLRALHGSLLC